MSYDNITSRLVCKNGNCTACGVVATGGKPVVEVRLGGRTGATTIRLCEKCRTTLIGHLTEDHDACGGVTISGYNGGLTNATWHFEGKE